MQDQFFRLAVALAIGLLVGLERGWREREGAAGSRTAGLRTFGIFGLLGGVFAVLAAEMSAPVILVAGFLGMAGLYGLFQFHEARQDRDASVTGVMAGLGVFGLGALAVGGDYRVAAAGGAALAAVLASREALHAALRRLSWIELRSALVLAVMTTIILPILPDRSIDPWGGLNPREIWFFTVLIATISFAGYIAVRVLGAARGLLVSALAGALASSTAVTVALARMANDTAAARPLIGAAALAAAVSVLRVLAVVALLRPDLLPGLAPPALVAAGLLVGAGLWLLLRKASSVATGAGEPGAMLRNPFDLRALLVFAALFALVSTVSAAVVGRFGGGSLALTSALSGMFDVDVAVLSVLRIERPALDLPAMTTAILAALAANALGRMSLAAMAGPPRFWAPLAAVTLAAAGAAVAAWLLMPGGLPAP
ncbi:MgtC/SapB family protein [Paracoccus spongiarum]|uniref:MgtC/SapB family protein n=1 Tax=Paracoccus spongiarum TaxID=3064387 RepID=A0ABT9JCL3_9RHOB|nr:MgtC/SapB family protein [Paracoccus sp. 2205BS29-5]MDP5307555.1 MgtC/SapB family protein [Paracoccus sp. 2205BS29-5]